jgi:methionyl-tRNA formyltransferase
MRVIFMGSPDFALPSLKKLIDSKHDICAVYTQPPKPANRGMKMLKSKIHQLAEENNIKVETPKSLRNKESQYIFQNYKADIAIIVAYGLILPNEILQGTKYGCLNLHPSLLPRWRGAAPLQRQIMAGDKKSAICIMKMDEGLDTGDIYSQYEFEISDNMNVGDLHDFTADKGAEMLISAIDKIEQNEGIKNLTPQSSEGVTYANKINKEDEIIDFNKSGEEIINQIRGLSPYPGAFTVFEGKKFKIFEAEFDNIEELDDEKYINGQIIDNSFYIKCINGIVKPISIQKEGKKRMNIEDFLRGNNIKVGIVAENLD